MVIVFYHEISDHGQERLAEFSVDRKAFEKQVEYLQRNYTVVPVEEFVEVIVSGRKNPKKKLAAITFDGGYLGNYQHAFPILVTHGVPATIYVMTDPLDGRIPWERRLLYLLVSTKKTELTVDAEIAGKTFSLVSFPHLMSVKQYIQQIIAGLDSEGRDTFLDKLANTLETDIPDITKHLFLTWDRVTEMSRSSLITIGSHSLTHPRLTEISREEAWKEIMESKTRIESKIGMEVRSFCYPDGYFSPEIIELVKAAGYTSGLAVGTDGIANDMNKPGDDVYSLRRICMPDTGFGPYIASNVSGLLRTIKNHVKFLCRPQWIRQRKARGTDG